MTKSVYRRKNLMQRDVSTMVGGRGMAEKGRHCGWSRSTDVLKSKQKAESKVAVGNTYTVNAHHPVTYFLQPGAPPQSPQTVPPTGHLMLKFLRL